MIPSRPPAPRTGGGGGGPAGTDASSPARLARLVQNLRRFVPAELLARIESGQDGDLRAQVDQVVLFADVRSYTTLSQRMDDRQLAAFLDALYRIMVRHISANDGMVDKFMGDGVMALFDGEDAADRAVKAANDLQDGIRRYNLLDKPANLPAIELGVGIHAGRVLLGALGDERRAAITVIGDTVNVASRIEGMTKQFRARVIVSDAVAGRLRGTYRRRGIDTLIVRGRDEPVQLHEIYDSDPEFLVAHKDGTRGELARAIGLYAGRRFEEALAVFGACFRRHMSDSMLLDYLHRCHYFLKHPPAPGWRGEVPADPVIDWHHRRRYPRHPCRHAVVLWSGLKHPTQRRMPGQILDCSARGLQVRLPSFVRRGDSLLVTIPAGGPAISLGGRVVWCYEQPAGTTEGDRVLAGLEVVGISVADDHAFIARFIPSPPVGQAAPGEAFPVDASARVPWHAVLSSAALLAAADLPEDLKAAAAGLKAALDPLRDFVAALPRPAATATTGSRGGDGTAPSPVDTASGAIPEEASASGPLLPPSILVVEDNDENVQLMLLLLHRLGTRIDVACHGLEAMEKVQKNREAYDLIFMDLQMPVMDGFEATRRVRAVEQHHGQRTPIVALTAYEETQFRDRCLAAGMDGFLQKPVTKSILADAIRRFTGWDGAPRVQGGQAVGDTGRGGASAAMPTGPMGGAR